MATITSTPTGGNLTVNGTTQVSGTISWSKPTIPSGATISSCVLTGTATASMSKGSATITVNGTTVTSGTQFTINLGTTNNTTSVATTAKGGNKNSRGTVSFSNLVYTVTYSLDIPVTGITLSPTNITVQQNKSVIVNAILTPNDSTDEVIWSINDTNIATLTKQASSTQIGIDGKTVGETTITATTVKSGISVSEKVTVEPLMVEAKFEVYLFTGIYGNAAQGEKITNYSSIIDVDYSGTGEFNSLKPLNINIINKTYSLYEIQNYNNLNYSFSQLYSHEDIHNNKYIAEYSFNDEVTLTDNCTLRIYLFQGTFKTETSYTVIFKDWDGTVLKTQTVEEGTSATPPSNPSRDGYEFTGWDKDFSNITSDLILTAQYKEVARHLVVRYTAKTSGVSLNFNDNYDRVITETESNGIYTVEVYSTQDLNRFIFRDEPNLLTIEYLKITNKITDMSDMFYNCTSLEYVNTDGWDTSNVTLMRNTFQNCSSLVSVDVSSFDVSKVTLMDFMFDECESLASLDVSNWNTNSLTNANYIFNNCDKLKQLDLSSWNVNNMEYMNYMFSEEAALNQIDISNWKIPSTAYLNNIFQRSYNLRTVIMNNSDYNSVNMIIEKLISASKERPGTLNIKGIDDISQVNIATAESKYWNVVLDEESKPIYTVTFKDWDETILKIENVEEGKSATPPANPTRDGYTFTGWDVDFYNITSNLIITAQYKKESEEDIIEWTGVGTVESDLFAYAQPHSNYKINLDWENEYFDVIIKEELNFDWRYMNDAYIGNIVIGDCSYTISYGDGCTGLYNENNEYIGGSSNISEDDQYGLPQTMRFTKDGIYLIVESTPYLLTERPYEINQPIYIYEDNEVNNGVNGNYDLKFDLVVSERPNEEPEEPGLTEPVDGYIAKNLVSHGDWSYTFNIDWDTQYLDIEVLNYKLGIFRTDYYYVISNNSYNKDYSHESVNDFIIHDVEVESDRNDIDIIRYSKVDGVCIITSNGTQIIPGNSFANDNKMTIEAVIPTEWLVSNDGFMTFNIKITDITSSEEPEDDIIEWTGVGTVATNLSTEDDWTYKLNIDWDTQYVEINNMIADCGLFNYGADFIYLNNEYNFLTGDLIHCDETGMITIDSKNDYDVNLWATDISIKISKDNGFILSNNLNGESFTIENYPIIENSSTLYLSSLFRSEDGYSTIGEIKVVGIESEEPDNNELIQGDINDETGAFEDEVPNVVKTRYIDISNKKQILVNVLTEDVYVLKCYLYNANKELVKIIDISTDKKRMFGLDLQKIIDEVMNDGNE